MFKDMQKLIYISKHICHSPKEKSLQKNTEKKITYMLSITVYIID